MSMEPFLGPLLLPLDTTFTGELCCAKPHVTKSQRYLDELDRVPALKETVVALLGPHFPPGHPLYLGAHQTCQTRLCCLSTPPAQV